MKRKLSISAALAAVACICLFGAGCDNKSESTPINAAGTQSVQAVIWTKTRDWTETAGDGTRYNIEFGFRADGVVLWRRGDKL